MARKAPDTPPIRIHRASGLAYVNLAGHRHYLGRAGTPDVEQRYLRLIAQWKVTGRHRVIAASDLTITELLARFLAHVREYYRRPDGSTSGEAGNFKSVMAILETIYGSQPAKEFTPLDLKAVRQKLIEKGYCRRFINREVVRVRCIFKWAVSEGLIPVETHTALTTVAGLRAGQAGTREGRAVRPVADALVDATLPHLSPVVADMVQLQRLTGMRNGELCALRPCDLDLSKQPWVYRVATHKTQYAGRERLVLVGPQGQGILRKYLNNRPLDAPCFSPQESEARRLDERHANRLTPESYGNTVGSNRIPNPKRRPGTAYTRRSYYSAIQSGCRKAGVDCWHPHQLRHALGTRVRAEAGLEASRACLGHSTIAVTEAFYAERDLKTVADLMMKIG